MLGSDLMVRMMPCHDVTGRDIDEIDISSEASCRDVISQTRPDVVINAAAYTDVDRCETDRERCFSVNAEGVKNIALACEGKGIKVVHFSTDYVFDGRKGCPYTEDDSCDPLNIYGMSKREGEKYLLGISSNSILVRSSWLYGKNGKNFVKTIMDKIKTVNCLEVVDDQIGSPTYTRDLAVAVELLIEGNHTGVFHVTNRGNCSWYEFALKILAHTGRNDVQIKPIKSEALARPAARPPYSVLSCRKFIETTGKTMRYWQIALDDFMGII